jgi:hypothetical protein
LLLPIGQASCLNVSKQNKFQEYLGHFNFPSYYTILHVYSQIHIFNQENNYTPRNKT